MESKTKVIISARMSYVHVFKAKAATEGGEPKFSVSLIIPKKDKAGIAKINAAIKAAAEEGKATCFKGKMPKNLKLPLRDGDEEREDEAYAKSYFLNASSKTRPGIVDENRDEILDEEGFYSGCYGKASINFYPFSVNGNNGVAVGLNNLMFVKDGERLGGGGTKAEDEDWDADGGEAEDDDDFLS